MKKISQQLTLAGKTLTLETGQFAPLATAAVVARFGDTEVLATVVEGPKREDIDYFPLTVEYIERLYAGGRIKGSRWVKREGRPSDEAILIARLIDRSIRPLFPKDYKNEVQVVVTVLSVDGENEPNVLSIIAVSAALTISHIPWNGPVGAVCVGFVDDPETKRREFPINPGVSEGIISKLNMVISQTEEKTVMIEAEGKEVAEDVIVEAIEKANVANNELIAFIGKLAKDVGGKKAPITVDSVLLEAVARVEKAYRNDFSSLVQSRATRESTSQNFEALIETIFAHEKAKDPDGMLDKKTVAKAAETVFYRVVRERILSKGIRPDGRGVDEVRPIDISVSVLPRTHGSALFVRGNTQALTVVTLGSPRLEQLIESAEGEETKRYIHHYSMPPYSVGETGRMIGPSRREIGHGALAEKALAPLIPSQDTFPYTIRVVSEILSSNGSTSMAAACGSTLALMDAGVPITAPVAGVAMGMVMEEDKYTILTDILGLEDFSGDMDFKVAGTEVGITAIQLDVKATGLMLSQVAETLKKARVARLLILGKMSDVIAKAREKISEFAPKIEVLKVPVERIGEVIGPGGRMIRSIIAQTGATVDVEDDGKVTISATSGEAVAKASTWVKGLVREVQPGEVFEGVVKRILPFGAFVEILPGKEGMVHVSKMSTEFVKDPHDRVSIGDAVKVRVVEVDEQGRINLSMLFGAESREAGHGTEVRTQPRIEHPLAKQFRRERQQRFQKSPRFRRTHY